jgi:hypothetical protein
MPCVHLPAGSSRGSGQHRQQQQHQQQQHSTQGSRQQCQTQARLLCKLHCMQAVLLATHCSETPSTGKDAKLQLLQATAADVRCKQQRQTCAASNNGRGGLTVEFLTRPAVLSESSGGRRRLSVSLQGQATLDRELHRSSPVSPCSCTSQQAAQADHVLQTHKHGTENC